MSKASAALHIDNNLTSLIIQGGRDVNINRANGLCAPDLWVKGGALIEKSILVTGNINCADVIIGDISGDIYTNHIIANDLVEPVVLEGDFVITGDFKPQFGNINTPQEFDFLMFDGERWIPRSIDLLNQRIRREIVVPVEEPKEQPKEQSSFITINTESGILGGGKVELGSSLTLFSNGVLSLNAGRGLSSTGPTGAITLEIPAAGIASDMIAPGSVNNTHLASAGVTIHAGDGLVGGGFVELGGSTTISLAAIATPMPTPEIQALLNEVETLKVIVGDLRTRIDSLESTQHTHPKMKLVKPAADNSTA